MSFSLPHKGVADNKPVGPEDACISHLDFKSKYNLLNDTKMVHNSETNDKIDILSVLQDSFIHEENNDIFNDTNNAKETAQIHTLVQTGLIQSAAGSGDASAASEGENRVAEDNSSNTLRLVEFIVPVGSLGDHSYIQKVIF